jgi:hypothetical protein
MKRCWTLAAGWLLMAWAGGIQAQVTAKDTPCGIVKVGLNTVAADTWFSGPSPSPEGPLAELARRALASQGCEVELQRMPLARLLTDAQQGLVDVALVLTVNPERLRTLRFPETADGEPDRNWALGRTRVSLFALRTSAAALNQQRLDPSYKNLTVAAQRASVGEEAAKEAGWTLTYAPDAARAAAMLRLQRADLMIAPEWALGRDTLDLAPALVALEPPVRLQHYYAPVSRAFWARDPRRVQRIWRALCQHAALLGDTAEGCPALQRKASTGNKPD